MADLPQLGTLFDPSQIGQYFRTVRGSTTTISGGPVVVAKANPNRVLLAFQSATNPYQVTPGIPLTNDTGLNIPSGSLPLILTFSDWGGIIGSQWYATSPFAGGVNVFVTEVIYYPTVQ
jgi:hypothetical protein